MYTPNRFQAANNTEILELIRQNPFAALISFDGEKPVASHLPIEVEQMEDGRLFLTGHMARANSQWQKFDENLEVMAIFTGAHAYISPRWYSEPLKNVPTWNYSAVHVYGKPRLIHEPQELLDLLKKLIDRYENGTTYKLEFVTPEVPEQLVKAIVGFRIEVTKIEATFKLSQHHRDLAHYTNVIAELEKRGDENSLAVARAMRKISFCD
ncbi:MAG: FMN-binding negative transcriptional regulator [Pyrinomonadaceae bacterium]